MKIPTRHILILCSFNATCENTTKERINITIITEIKSINLKCILSLFLIYNLLSFIFDIIIYLKGRRILDANELWLAGFSFPFLKYIFKFSSFGRLGPYNKSNKQIKK